MTTGKSSSLLILFVLATLSVHAQPLHFDRHSVDSLEKILPKMVNDTNKVNNLMDLSQMILETSADRSLAYARIADTLSQELKYDRGRVRSLANIAFYYAGRADWPKSFAVLDEVWPLAQKAFPEQIPFLCSIMYMNYAFKKEMNKARSWGFKGLNDPAFPNLPDEGKWPTYFQIAIGYATDDILDSAEYYASFLKTYISKKMNAAGMLENSYRVLGLISRKRKNYEEALDYFKRDTALASEVAQVYDELKQTDSAIYYAKIGLDHAIRKQFPPELIACSSILARLYQETNAKLAYKYLRIYSETMDTLYSSNRAKDVEERSLAIQKDQFQKETHEANFRNRTIQISLFALAAVLLVSTLLFLRSNRIKQNANRKLEKAFADLKATQAQLIQAEKMASLGELTAGIAHEIQNPLNFVNNFSEVNQELANELKSELAKGNTAAAEAIAGDIIQNEEKIIHHGKKADAIVKSMLQHSRAGAVKKEPTDINALADEYLRLSYHGFRARDKSFNAVLKTDFDESIGKIDIVPQDMGRVVLNLVNNAFYACTELRRSTALLPPPAGGFSDSDSKRTPTIWVSTKNVGDNVLISVRDNGPGIPQKILDKIFQPFFTTKPTGQGTGLGLSLSYDIIKAYGGEIKVESTEGEGSEFLIQIPIKKP